MKQIIKKGTDILELRDSGGEGSFIVKTKSVEGRRLIKALESIAGSPALDDYADQPKEAPSITIRRYRPKEDVELVEP